MSDDAPDLSLVSTDDMIREIFSRYDHVLMVREKDARKPETAETLFEFCGGVSAAIGLAERAKMRLFKMIGEANGDGA